APGPRRQNAQRRSRAADPARQRGRLGTRRNADEGRDTHGSAWRSGLVGAASDIARPGADAVRSDCDVAGSRAVATIVGRSSGAGPALATSDSRTPESRARAGAHGRPATGSRA